MAGHIHCLPELLLLLTNINIRPQLLFKVRLCALKRYQDRVAERPKICLLARVYMYAGAWQCIGIFSSQEEMSGE